MAGVPGGGGLDLFTLQATLGLNTDPYEQAIRSATEGFTQFLNYLHENAVIQVKLAFDVITDFGKDIFDTGLEYDKALGMTFSVNNADEAERALYEQTVLAEAAASTFTTAETAAAGYYTGLAGWDLTQASEAMHGLIVGAEAFGIDMNKSTDIVTDVVSQFGMEAGDALQIVNTLSAGISNTNTNVEQLYNALKYVGPVAHAMGYDLESTVTLLGIFGDNAIKSGMAGTSLRNIFQRIATNAGQTQKDLGALSIVTEKLGVDFFDTEGNTRDLITVFGEMIQTWHGMSEADRLQVFDEFGDIVIDGREASEIIKSFSTDVDMLQGKVTQLNNTKSDEAYAKLESEIKDTASQYSELLTLMGIPVPDNAVQLVNALDRARIKLGKMSDKEEIYFAKQIGGLRGMSALLALLNTDYNTYLDKVEKVADSEGAADKMREERMNNLWGDLKHLSSEYNSLQTALYNDAKGPFRPIVQFVAEAVSDINDAFSNGGLEEGLDTAIDKLDEFLSRKDVSQIINTVGTVLGKILSAVITELQPKIRDELAPQLASAFFSGIGDSAKGNMVAQLLTGILPEWAQKILLHKNMQDEFDYASVTDTVGGVEVPAKIIPNLDAQDLQSAIDAALENGNLYIDLGLISGSGVHWTIHRDDAQKIVDELGGAEHTTFPEWQDPYTGPSIILDAAIAPISLESIQAALDAAQEQGEASILVNNVEFPSDADAQSILDVITDHKYFAEFNTSRTSPSIVLDAGIAPITLDTVQAALDAAREQGEATIMVNGVEFPTTTNAQTIMESIGKPVTDGIDLAVTNGAATGAVNMEGILDQTSQTAASNLESAIGDAGTPAGNTFGENFQTSLNNRTYSVQVDADVGGLPVQHNARAMTGGRIFKRPTIFGYAEGSYQVAGDAGPEAVVGVNSLYGMISQAVDNTMGQRMEYTEPLTTPEPTYYESTSGAVERVTNYGSDSGYRSVPASTAMSNTLTAIYAAVQKISSSFDAKAMASTATASMLSAIDNSIFSNTEATIFSADSAANIVRDELFSNTEATIYSAENAANLLRNEIYSNTEATILSGDSVASTISGTITTYADMMMATMAEILTAVRICASKNNNASMEMDGTTFARVFLPYLNREQQRLGVNLSKGAAL